jgi:RNA polymerase sigma factor for flagellar operon FliA
LGPRLSGSLPGGLHRANFPPPVSPQIAELMHGCQGLVRSIAWKIHQKVPRSVDLDDLIGYGQIGLAEAARDFDVSRGNQFTTYAYYRVRGAILDGLATMSWFSRADYFRGRYEQAANAVLHETESEASLAGELQWFAGTTRSLSAAWMMNEYAAEVADETRAGTTPPSAGVEAEDLKRLMGDALAKLEPQERTLIEAIYFEGLTIKEAGERIGISKAWASRQHARILSRLALQLSDQRD